MANLRPTSFCSRFSMAPDGTTPPTPVPPGPSLISRYIAYSNDSGVFADQLMVVNWNSTTGFGVRFPGPTTFGATSGNHNQLEFTHMGDAVAMATSLTPFVTAYRWSASGFGAQYSNPGTLPSSASINVNFTTEDDAIIVGSTTAPVMSAYPWSAATGFGTRFADPSIPLPFTGGFNSPHFSNGSNSVVIGTAATPFIHGYKWTRAGFGMKHANPSSLAANQQNDCRFTPADDAVVSIGTTGSPFVHAWMWSPLTGFGTKYGNPASLPVTGGSVMAMHPAGNAVAFVNSTSPNIQVYAWSSSTGFGTKYTAPISFPININHVSWTRLGDAIAVTCTGSPFVAGWPWDAVTGFGTRFASPAPALPAINPRFMAFGV